MSLEKQWKKGKKKKTNISTVSATPTYLKLIFVSLFFLFFLWTFPLQTIPSPFLERSSFFKYNSLHMPDIFHNFQGDTMNGFTFQMFSKRLELISTPLPTPPHFIMGLLSQFFMLLLSGSSLLQICKCKSYVYFQYESTKSKFAKLLGDQKFMARAKRKCKLIIQGGKCTLILLVSKIAIACLGTWVRSKMCIREHPCLCL